MFAAIFDRRKGDFFRIAGEPESSRRQLSARTEHPDHPFSERRRRQGRARLHADRSHGQAKRHEIIRVRHLVQGNLAGKLDTPTRLANVRRQHKALRPGEPSARRSDCTC